MSLEAHFRAYKHPSFTTTASFSDPIIPSSRSAPMASLEARSLAVPNMKRNNHSKQTPITLQYYVAETAFCVTVRQSSGPGPLKTSRDNPRSAISGETTSPRPATSLAQRLINTTKTSSSFPTGTKEISRPSKSLLLEHSQICDAQLTIDSESHGAANPSSFKFDRSAGYLRLTGSASETLSLEGGNSKRNADVDCSSLASFLEVISSERLNRMPHRASKWDQMMRVLGSESASCA